MKTILKISVLLNVILLGGVMLLWRHDESTVHSPQSTVQAPTLRPIPAPVVQTVVETAPFHWNQLVNTNDYRAFVANLRAAGCPESTVENIVQGDTEQVFSLMRERLGVSPTEAGRWSAQSQVQMVAYLLGQTPAPATAQDMVAAATAPSSPAQRRVHPPLEQPVATMPVPIEDIDPAALAALNLSDDQKKLIADVQRTYSAALNPGVDQKQTTADAGQSSQNQAGDTTQNPQNPVSQNPTAPANSQQAQADADAELQAELGLNGYLGYKLAEEQTVLENQWKLHPSWVLVDPQ